MSSEYQIIDPRNKKNYNELLLNSEDYSVFHTENWAKVICEAYDYTPLYLAVENNDRFESLIPIMHVNSFLTGKRLVSLTFSDFCEPIILNKDPELFREFFQQMIALGRKTKVNYIQFNTSKNYLENDLQPSTVYGHELNLDQTEDELMNSFRKDTRTNINKANENGIIVKIDNSEDSLRKYYDLHCITRKRLGLPPQPYLFFKLILKHLISQNMGFIILAYLDNHCIAGAIYLYIGEKAIYKFSASDPEFRHSKANNIVMWESILYCKKLNLKSLHLGKTEEQHTGLRTYKRGWGGEESVIRFYKYSLPQDKFVDNNSTTPEFFHKIFRGLPIFTLKKIGYYAYKHFG